MGDEARGMYESGIAAWAYSMGIGHLRESVILQSQNGGQGPTQFVGTAGRAVPGQKVFAPHATLLAYHDSDATAPVRPASPRALVSSVFSNKISDCLVHYLVINT